jgi:Flp pilus assembly protein CpaB
MRRGGRILIIVGIILALGTAGAAVFILQQKPQPAELPPGAMTPTPEMPMTEVVVAVQDIPQNSPLPPDALRLEERPDATLPPDPVTSIEETQGKIAAVQIFRGQVLQQQMLTTEEVRGLLGGDAATLISPGKVAVVLPVNRLTSVGYAVRAGDRVDVLISVELFDVDSTEQMRLPLPSCEECITVAQTPLAPCWEECTPRGVQIPRHVVQLTLQDVEVIRVGNWPYGPEAEEGAPAVEEAPTEEAPPPEEEGEEAPPPPTPPPPNLVTLVLSQQDALVLKYAREKSLGIELALRGVDDHNLVNTEAVTMDYMLARFNIPSPPKRPYGTDPTIIKDVTPSTGAQPQ